MRDDEEISDDLKKLLDEVKSEGLSITEEANYASGHCLVLMAIIDNEFEFAKDKLIEDIAAFYTSTKEVSSKNQNLDGFLKAVRHQIETLGRRVPKLAEQIASWDDIT